MKARTQILLWLKVISVAVFVLLLGVSVFRFVNLARSCGVDHAISVAGDTARNTSGLFAVIAACIAAWIAYSTNKARSEEAARAHFKDRLQWAVEHSYTANELEGALAESFIASVQKDFRYTAEDISIAQTISERQRKARQRLEDRSAEFEWVVSECLKLLLNEFRAVELSADEEDMVRELQLDFRKLKFGLTEYNKDIQHMLMADKMQKIVDIYRGANDRGGQTL